MLGRRVEFSTGEVPEPIALLDFCVVRTACELDLIPSLRFNFIRPNRYVSLAFDHQDREGQGQRNLKQEYSQHVERYERTELDTKSHQKWEHPFYCHKYKYLEVTNSTFLTSHVSVLYEWLIL